MIEQKGVSLVETILVVVTLGFIVILMANLPSALGLITKSRHLSLAKEIAVKQIEDKRATNYANLVNDTVPISDTRLSLLPGGLGSITIEECLISICTNSEHVKLVKVSVTFKENNKTQTINLETFIGEGGLNQ